MGKGQSPTPNELKFIYEMLAAGYSDTDILANYDELKKHGKLGGLPCREDVRFIRQRRKEFEAARSILEDTIKQQADPALAKARDEHFAEIRHLIASLLDIARTPYVIEVTLSNKDFPYFMEKVYSSFELKRIEDNVLFQCLRSHLPSS